MNENILEYSRYHEKIDNLVVAFNIIFTNVIIVIHALTTN